MKNSEPTNVPDHHFRVRFKRGRDASSTGSGAQLFRSAVKSLGDKGKQVSGTAKRGGGKQSCRWRASAVSVKQSQFAQRVIVKARIQPSKGKSAGAAIRKHLKYIEREGVSKDGSEGQIFSEEGSLSREEINSFAERGESCRHQFRFIVSPEQGTELELESYTRSLLKKMSYDLGTKLDWVAAAHYDTDQPHIHVIVNGKDECNGDLVISRDYIGTGLRSRAGELATNELGYRSEYDILVGLKKELNADRFTGIDRQLIKAVERSPTGEIDLSVTPSDSRAIIQRNLRLGRLAYLKSTGLADEVRPSVWKLKSDMLDELRDRTKHRQIHDRIQAYAKPEDRVLNVEVIDKDNMASPVVGKVLGRGIANELTDAPFIVISGNDGRTYYAALSPSTERNFDTPIQSGDIVKLEAAIPPATGSADKSILAFSKRDNGVYDADKHLVAIKSNENRFVPNGLSPEAYVNGHVHRLEALASRGHVERLSDRTFRVPENVIDRIEADPSLSSNRAKYLKAEIKVHGSLQAQSRALRYTWLDEQLSENKLSMLTNHVNVSAYQKELRGALVARSQQLQELSLVTTNEKGEIALDPQLRGKLTERELAHVAESIANRYGKYVPLDHAREFKGQLNIIETTHGNAYAIVENKGQFTVINATQTMKEMAGRVVEVTAQPEYSLSSPDRALQQLQARVRAFDVLEIGQGLGRGLNRKHDRSLE